jgi:hypothetical protein
MVLLTKEKKLVRDYGGLLVLRIISERERDESEKVEKLLLELLRDCNSSSDTSALVFHLLKGIAERRKLQK